MSDQEPYVDLHDLQWKAREKFNRCSAEFKSNLAWVSGAFVKTYVEALCDWIVASRKVQDGDNIPFTISGDVVDACRVANLEFKNVLEEQLERLWTDGNVKVAVRTIIHTNEDVSLKCMVNLDTTAMSLHR